MSLLLLLLQQTSRACAPNAIIMHGVGLGPPLMSKSNATSWTECCDLCAGESKCVAWTHLQAENICLLRDEIGTNFDLKAPNKVSAIMKTSLVPVPQRHDNDPWVHVGILSAPKNRAKRDEIRAKCLPRFKHLLQTRRLTYEFVIGRPHDKLPAGHLQGYINRNEAAAAKKLWQENEEFGDISFMTSRDTYVDLPTKTLEVVKRGVLRGAKYIVKMDDDMCMDPVKLAYQVKKAKEPKYGFFANYIWDYKAYESQKGADGKFVKYMSGPIYALTFDLAKLITFADINYAAMYPMYGSDSEDVDMGRWVNHAMKKHNVTVKYVTAHIGDNLKGMHR